jgi:hypothetical protein
MFGMMIVKGIRMRMIMRKIKLRIIRWTMAFC